MFGNYTVVAHVAWNDNVNELSRKLDGIIVTLQASNGITCTWTETSDVSMAPPYLKGNIEMKITGNGDIEVPKDQVVTITLKKKGGSWSKTMYRSLSGCTVGNNANEYKIPFEIENLEENGKYILNVKGIVRETVSMPNGQDKVTDHVETLWEMELTAKPSN